MKFNSELDLLCDFSAVGFEFSNDTFDLSFR